MKIADIQPYPKNGKKHTKKQIEQVANSIKEFGMNQPIVVDKQGIIIVGHGRYEACKLLGIEPEIKVLDISEEKANAYRLADNKLNESEWDMKLVIEELKTLSLPMVELTGFDKDLLIEFGGGDDEIPDMPDKPKTKLGDLYELGSHRVLCGDCTQPEAVLRLMEGKKADLVFTDPPYNVDYQGMQNSKQWDKIENDAISPVVFKEFLIKVFDNYFDYSKPESAIYICHADKSHKEFRDAFESVGYLWRATIIWVKNSPAFNFAQYKYSHEPIFYCFKKDQTVKWLGDNRNRTVWEAEWDDNKIIDWFKRTIKLDKEQAKTTIWEAKKEHGNHPTIKPVELIAKALRNSSSREDLVIDFFGGSGSTLIASEKFGRVCNMMELQPVYCDVIVQRYVDYTGVTEVKKNGIIEIWNKSEKNR